jgi:hypothetical protein
LSWLSTAAGIGSPDRRDTIATDSLAAGGRALVDGKVTLTVVRSDDEAAAMGDAVFVLRKLASAVLAPPGCGAISLGRLKGGTFAQLRLTAGAGPVGSHPS